ncbi:MAG: tryptophan synthase subunit alpha [Clostridium sp.]
MNRIDNVFNHIKRNSKKALVPFVTCGDLSIEDTAELVLDMDKVGADIVEIGIPFSDPLADGEVIQESYSRALKNGTKLKDVFKCVELIRNSSQIPLVFMAYYNIIFCYGIDKFLKMANDKGVDGLIVPDIPLEERKDLAEKCEKNHIYLIPLVAPTSKERIGSIVEKSKGFVYCVATNGTTGERSTVSKNIKEYLNLVKSYTDNPMLLGFGISSRETVREVKNYCDGVIVGSAIVRRMSKGKEGVIQFLLELRKELDL